MIRRFFSFLASLFRRHDWENDGPPFAGGWGEIWQRLVCTKCGARELWLDLGEDDFQRIYRRRGCRGRRS